MTIEELDKALEEVGCEVTVLDPDGSNIICPQYGGEPWPGDKQLKCHCGRPAIRHLHWKDGSGNEWSCEAHWRQIASQSIGVCEGQEYTYLSWWQHLREKRDA